MHVHIANVSRICAEIQRESGLKRLRYRHGYVDLKAMRIAARMRKLGGEGCGATHAAVGKLHVACIELVVTRINGYFFSPMTQSGRRSVLGPTHFDTDNWRRGRETVKCRGRAGELEANCRRSTALTRRRDGAVTGNGRGAYNALGPPGILV